MTDYTAQAAAIRATQAAKVADITNRRDLSDDGKRRQLARVHAKARDDMKNLRAKAAAAADQRRHTIMTELFGSSTSDSAAVMSYRSALSEAEKLTNPAQAAELLQRARITRDPSLARAVAAKALNEALSPTAAAGWTEVLNEWGSETQQRDDLLTELSGLDADSKPSRGLLAYSIPRPAGLSTSDDIDRLAADADQDNSDPLTGARASSWHD
jgi:hypothetical protein